MGLGHSQSIVTALEPSNHKCCFFTIGNWPMMCVISKLGCQLVLNIDNLALAGRYRRWTARCVGILNSPLQNLWFYFMNQTDIIIYFPNMKEITANNLKQKSFCIWISRGICMSPWRYHVTYFSFLARHLVDTLIFENKFIQSCWNHLTKFLALLGWIVLGRIPSLCRQLQFLRSRPQVSLTHM